METVLKSNDSTERMRGGKKEKKLRRDLRERLGHTVVSIIQSVIDSIEDCVRFLIFA